MQRFAEFLTNLIGTTALSKKGKIQVQGLVVKYINKANEIENYLIEKEK